MSKKIAKKKTTPASSEGADAKTAKTPSAEPKIEGAAENNGAPKAESREKKKRGRKSKAKKEVKENAVGASGKEPSQAAEVEKAETTPPSARALPEAAGEKEVKQPAAEGAAKTAKRKSRRKPKAKKTAAPAAETAASAEPAPEVEPVEEKAAPKKPAKAKKKKKAAPKKPVRTEEDENRLRRVVVASQNPAKIKAVELGFSKMFPEKEFVFEGISVASGVSDQPMSDDETFVGALNRAMSARQEEDSADFWVGLEGGLQEEGDDFFAFAWIIILGPQELQGRSRTGTFAIPPAVSELVRNGKELGEADDIVFSQTNSKQSSGAIGILTHGVLDRANYYADAVLMALIPFKNTALYLLEEEVSESV